MLQALTYVATGASVLLGTLHMDLYIAVTTATVSLLTGILEYQKLEATVINLNNSSRVLQHTLMWCAASGSALRMRACLHGVHAAPAQVGQLDLRREENGQAQGPPRADDRERPAERGESVLPEEPGRQRGRAGGDERVG